MCLAPAWRSSLPFAGQPRAVAWQDQGARSHPGVQVWDAIYNNSDSLDFGPTAVNANADADAEKMAVA